MYQEFAVVSIDTIIQDKQIILTSNKAINQNSLNDIVIELFERATKTPLIFDYEVDFDKLIIKLKEWPIPNTDYILGVAGMTSITDETLGTNIKKRLQFKSNVVSIVKITSPIMFEEIKSLDIKLLESAEDATNLTNSFYIEVATDNSFFNITNKTTLNSNTVTIALKEQGQHFIRARVQTDDANYSIWSPVISFIYGANVIPPVIENEDDDEIDIETDLGDDMDPVIDISGPFEIIEFPDQGITPEEALLIAFSNNLDDMSIDNIMITRKDVR